MGSDHKSYEKGDYGCCDECEETKLSTRKKKVIMDTDCAEVCNSCMKDIECFGEDSKKYANCLLEYIYNEYSDYRYYCTLAKNCCNPELSRKFKAIANNELRLSNTFVSSYFLITGKRFCPAKNCMCDCDEKPFAHTLRNRYFEEICASKQYKEYACTVEDKCLKDVLLQASEDKKEHARIIMDIISTICACD